MADSSKTAACCPPGGLGYLKSSGKPKGEKHIGVDFYRTGKARGNKAIILVSDVWGWNSGRVRALADHFADCGYYCVVPKLLNEPAFEGGIDGDGLPVDFEIAKRRAELGPWIKQHVWKGKTEDRMQALIGHILSAGCQPIIGMIGCCYGAWVALKTAASSFAKPFVKGCVMFHPSCHLEGMHGGDPAAVAKGVTAATLLCPAGNDEDCYRTGGATANGFKEGNAKSACMDKEFATEKHGFVTRGDSTNAQTAKCITLAIDSAVKWFKAHLV